MVERRKKYQELTHSKKNSLVNQDLQGYKRARDWNRTSTSLRTADFESAASTNSATRAGGCNITTSRLIAAEYDGDIFSYNNILLPAAILFR